MKRLFAALSAGLCMLLPAHMIVSADSEQMTYELIAERQRVSVDELKDGGLTLHGQFFIRNYDENCTAVRAVLISDAPLEIVNGKLTQPYFFDDCFFRAYTQQSIEADYKNIVVWNAPSDLELGLIPMKIAEPESSFAEFDIFIPEDTAPGAYQLGFLTGVHEDPNGGRIVNTYAQSFTDDIALTLTGCTITVEAAKLRGDVDRDGILAVNDAVLLQRYVTEDLTAEEAAALDVEDLDGDEELTVSDVCWILETLSNEKG